MKNWNTGATMGLCLFMGQAFCLKAIEELQKYDYLNDGWKLVLSAAVLLVGWQAVQSAYGRGLRDATRDATSDSSGS